MHLLFVLLGNVCTSAMIAYLLGRGQYIYRYMVSPLTWRAGATLTFIFSSLAIVSSYYGVRILGALASTRVVGTLMGGLVGGPYVGLAVGIISGFHRYLLGGFTASSCAAATALAGLMAGLVRLRYGFKDLNWQIAVSVALVAEFIQKGLTLIFAKPFEAALEFEKIAGLPTTAVTVIGTTLFILILQDMQKQSELAGAKAAQKALSIANEAIPFLQSGLTGDSAQKIALIIVKNTDVAAVAITDATTVLAYEGIPSKCHRAGIPIYVPDTEKVLRTGKSSSFSGEHGCGDPDCPLYYGITVPLMLNKKPIGIIRFYATQKNGISVLDEEMLEGIGNFLSTYFALADYERQEAMLEQTEQKALESQINPHFLFNTLSIIMSFCRTDPEMARELLGNLTDMLHFCFAHHNTMIPIQEEYATVLSYLNIVKARFGSRFSMKHDVDDDLMDCLVPAFILQPLVENAVTHGLFPKPDDCRLTIVIRGEADRIVIKIEDNGVGMSDEKRLMLQNLRSEGIGVANVLKRLKSIYKGEATVSITSAEGQGTSFVIVLPLSRKK